MLVFKKHTPLFSSDETKRASNHNTTMKCLPKDKFALLWIAGRHCRVNKKALSSANVLLVIATYYIH